LRRTDLRDLLLLQVKFAASGLAATALDYVLYLVLVGRFFPPVAANVTSYSIAVIVNFLLQKKFVFTLRRKAPQAFAGAMLVSVGGLLLSTGIVYALSQFAFFYQRQYLTKLAATGIVFFYNFFLKRFVFEGRFLGNDR
jgi:putative flippase GtrA